MLEEPRHIMSLPIVKDATKYESRKHERMPTDENPKEREREDIHFSSSSSSSTDSDFDSDLWL